MAVIAVTRIVGGRSLCFSPDWGADEPSVVFDRNSGDYWIVASLARTVLGLLTDDGPLSTPQICEALQARQVPDELVGDALEATLDDLVRADILSFSAANAGH